MEEYIVSDQRILSGRTGIPSSLKEICTSCDTKAFGIRISRLPVHLYVTVSNNKSGIFLECFASRRGNEIALSLPLENYTDYILLDSVCYPFDDSISDISSLFKRAKVTDKRILSIAQYICIKRLALCYPNVEFVDTVDFKALQTASTKYEKNPVALKASLYQYQQQGYRWMAFAASHGCGCILGDEMGLGKTLQIITLITSRIGKHTQPSLVIAPVSLLENWKREFGKFTTGIDVFVHHGPKRTGLYTELMCHDVVVISYNTACSDQSILKMVAWDLVVLDEAQNIKNPNAIRTKSVKAIPKNAGIAVTGTPFENHVTDLWSLLDYIAPGCLGTLSEFEREISDDVDGAKKIEPILSPVMIRRRVADVAQDLPERIDIPQVLTLSDKESLIYEDTRNRILDEYAGKKATLPMLQKLRMFCTHPFLMDDADYSDPLGCSTKYERLCELLEEIITLGEKTILFTSYNSMFDILGRDIPKRFGIKVFSINGSTPSDVRQPIVDSFSKVSGAALLVLNPRAAGTGLNITSASRVIHYNLEWNPALEDQASARAYRRGQTQTVFVYRLYYKDTVEEIINDRLERKREIFGTAVVGNDGSKQDSDDIMRALMISPGGRKNNE